MKRIFEDVDKDGWPSTVNGWKDRSLAKLEKQFTKKGKKLKQKEAVRMIEIDIIKKLEEISDNVPHLSHPRALERYLYGRRSDDYDLVTGKHLRKVEDSDSSSDFQEEWDGHGVREHYVLFQLEVVDVDNIRREISVKSMALQTLQRLQKFKQREVLPEEIDAVEADLHILECKLYELKNVVLENSKKLFHEAFGMEKWSSFIESDFYLEV